METLTSEEHRLLEQLPPTARLAVIEAGGFPSAMPVRWLLGDDTIEVVAAAARLPDEPAPEYDERVALIVDDDGPAPHDRGIKIQGRTQRATVPGAAFQVVPERITRWDVEDGTVERVIDARERADPTIAPRRRGGRMQAVVRKAEYDLAALEAAPDRMARFERVHAEQPGYAGNVVVELGGGERLMVTLWRTEEHARAARSALGPVVQELLAPLERTPSHLLGVGTVVSTDLLLAER